MGARCQAFFEEETEKIVPLGAWAPWAAWAAWAAIDPARHESMGTGSLGSAAAAQGSRADQPGSAAARGASIMVLVSFFSRLRFSCWYSAESLLGFCVFILPSNVFP